MAKFDNAKIGDMVWNSVYGWGRIIEVNKDECYGIKARFPYSDIGSVTGEYTFSGETCTEDKYPVLFWNEFHIPTDEEDKKPFNLVEFLRDNLKPKEFEQGKSNRYISYEYDSKKLECYADYNSEDIGAVYLEGLDDYHKIISELTINEVTLKQLKQAYKELGWL